MDVVRWTIRGALGLALACGSPPEPAPEPPPPPPADTTPPRVELAGERGVDQGHTLALFVRTDEPATVEATFLDRDRSLHRHGPGWRLIVGVPIRATPGPTPVVLRAVDGAGNAVTHTVAVTVREVDWPYTGKLPMSRRAAAVEPEGRARMRAERDAVYADPDGPPRWTAPFVLPVEGAVHTSAFGSFREYPDGSRNHHDAEDLARRRGVPVHAAAPARVALAHLQELHGNAVLLHHGAGVVSLYSHLDTLAVEAGATIQPGDRLGTMGSTGRTTGPHLHWGVVVDGVPVDPMEWTTRDFTLPADAEWSLASGLP